MTTPKDLNRLCDLGGQVHTWNPSRPLDIHSDGTLVTVRRCLRCGREEAKPYGSTKPWRRVEREVLP